MATLLDTVLTVDAARALAATPLFGGLSAVDLARLVPELGELQYSAGDAVFRQGDPGDDGLDLIRRGSVGVSVGSNDQQRIVAVLEAPAYFGEMALLSEAPRSATILALHPLQVWRLPRERFDRLIERQAGGCRVMLGVCLTLLIGLLNVLPDYLLAAIPYWRWLGLIA